MPIQLPHLFKPRDYQLSFLKAMDSGITRAILVWNRRSGKDKTCFNFTVKKAFERVGTYYYFLPTYSQAKKVIWDNIDNDGMRMLEHIPQELIKSTNATELKIELVNGSFIQLIGADEFKKSGVGTNPVGVVFSEYSITNPEAWKFLSPILAVNGGWAVFNFTPRGTNHAFQLLQQYKGNPKWFTEVLTLDDTKVLTKEQIEEEKQNNPQDFIEQEYYCKFIEGAGAFFRRIKESLCIPIDKPIPGHTYQMGIDLAKYNDYTVITLLDLNTLQVNKQIRFNQIDYTFQKARIETEYLRYGKPIINIDSTGVGEPIYDDLLHRGLRVIPYRFTEQTRKDLLVNLQLLLEQNKVKIPEDDTLIGELMGFQYTLTESGKTKIQVPDGMHDDCVFSLALACINFPSIALSKPNSIQKLFEIKEQQQVKVTSYE